MYQHDQIISEVGDILGISLNFDNNGECALQFDENLFVSLHIWKNDTWLLTGLLQCTFPTEPDTSLWKKFMILNKELAMDNVGNLVYSEEDDNFWLTGTITDLSNVHAIIKYLENFVNRLEYLIYELQRELI